VIIDYRVNLAHELRKWADAEHLLRKLVDWCRQRTVSILAMPKEMINDRQRNAIRNLAASIERLGHNLREQDRSDCIPLYEEAIQLFEHIDDKTAEANVAFNIGHAYKNIATLRDLDRAEHWYRRSLEQYSEHDQLNRSRAMDQIGMVLHDRLLEGRKAGASNDQLRILANEVIQSYKLSLDWSPKDAIGKLAASHQHLGAIYFDTGHPGPAISHWGEAIRYFELEGNLYPAAQTRTNVAIALSQAGRLADAREYAYAALRNFETYDERAAEEIQKTRGLIEGIEKMMKG
ncbi:MAG: hypothetical protein AAB217_12610, partial [Chloroflexota bacterium]